MFLRKFKLVMAAAAVAAALAAGAVALAQSGIGTQSENDQEHHKIVLTSPKATDVVITQPYVGRIHSHRHINVRASESGYLSEIKVREGQAVKKGDLMFKIVPRIHGCPEAA